MEQNVMKTTSRPKYANIYVLLYSDDNECEPSIRHRAINRYENKQIKKKKKTLFVLKSIRSLRLFHNPKVIIYIYTKV